MSTRYSSSSSSSSGGGIGFVGLLTIVFVTLKLLNVINWSWWWVVSPIWITASLVLITVVLGFIGYQIYKALRRNK